MSNSTRFDKILRKFQVVKEELSKAKVKVDLGMPAKKGKTATNEYVEKYDESRQSGANQEPPMTTAEKTKKAEFLAMSKHGQWSLGKTEHVGQDNSKAKAGKEKVMPLTSEKSSPHKEVKGEPMAGSGKDRMAKNDEELEKSKNDLIQRAKAFGFENDQSDYKPGQHPYETMKRRNILKDAHRSIRSQQADGTPIHADHVKLADEIERRGLHKADECHADDPHHEAKEKNLGKKIKSEAQRLLDMHKEEAACKMDDATTLAGPISNTVATKTDEGATQTGGMMGIEKKDLPKDAEYQKHIKREAKDRA